MNARQGPSSGPTGYSTCGERYRRCVACGVFAVLPIVGNLDPKVQTDKISVRATRLLPLPAEAEIKDSTLNTL